MAEDLGISMAGAALEMLAAPVLRSCSFSLQCSTGNFTQQSFSGKGKSAPSIFPVLGLSVRLRALSVSTVALFGRKGEKKNAPFPTKV